MFLMILLSICLFFVCKIKLVLKMHAFSILQFFANVYKYQGMKQKHAPIPMYIRKQQAYMHTRTKVQAYHATYKTPFYITWQAHEACIQYLHVGVCLSLGVTKFKGVSYCGVFWDHCRQILRDYCGILSKPMEKNYVLPSKALKQYIGKI